jgi:hypothetical protein
MHPQPLKPRHLRAADIHGLALLASQGMAGVVRMVEGVHQSVWDTLGIAGPAPQRTGGLTGAVYQGLHRTTRLLSQSLDTLLTGLQPLLPADGHLPGSPQREAVLAALNGVVGDRLVASGNPLATRMSLRHQGQALDPRALSPSLRPTGKILLLVHGLCMNDLQWQVPPGHEPPASDHGQALGYALGYTPLYLRYNSGLHISENGHALARLLEDLVAHWPVPVQDISIVAHSMGGLVARSATHCARQDGSRWPQHLKNLVFLGTPHHGAPLERAGNWLDVLLGSTRYSAPFARLGQLRSAGITDLRYGHVLDADWQGLDRFAPRADQRQPLPLPSGVACYSVAATLAAKRSLLADRLTGDGLVPLRSALGQHDDPAHHLAFDTPRQWIGYRLGHMALLHSPEVTRQLLLWLGKP